MSSPPRFQAPTGTLDVLPPASARWEQLLALFANTAGRAGYGLVINPMFEDIGVFLRGIGEGSEVVTKEMYEFRDKGDRHMALRPEGTASVARAFIQHRPALPFKAWYATPAFRYERPQAGRYRQHHQLGLEAFGVEDPEVDVEVISLAAEFYRAIGLRQVSLKINSMGDGTCRPAYVELLRAYLSGSAERLCDEHRTKFELNPLRVLDCKREECKAATAEAPALTDHLCEPCEAHYAAVLSGLDDLKVTYSPDIRLVRGFDYYSRTTFEFAADALGTAQNAAGGGGRYDGLVESLGGPATPGIGFGLGIERLLLACDAEGAMSEAALGLDAFVIDVVDGRSATLIAHELRAAGLRVDRAFDGRSMKSQMKAADRSGATVAVIIGEEEAAAGVATLRPLRGDHDQVKVPRAELAEAVRKMGRAEVMP
ncbi:MAG TPA: histidine--tRNA ligase [Acidimicrobiales bacterium]|nr:histidine--tRNA ligase [Acidimicrobiales bacterium]